MFYNGSVPDDCVSCSPSRTRFANAKPYKPNTADGRRCQEAAAVDRSVARRILHRRSEPYNHGGLHAKLVTDGAQRVIYICSYSDRLTGDCRVASGCRWRAAHRQGQHRATAHPPREASALRACRLPIQQRATTGTGLQAVHRRVSGEDWSAVTCNGQSVARLFFRQPRGVQSSVRDAITRCPLSR